MIRGHLFRVAFLYFCQGPRYLKLHYICRGGGYMYIGMAVAAIIYAVTSVVLPTGRQVSFYVTRVTSFWESVANTRPFP